jgi:hypothetical protein
MTRLQDSITQLQGTSTQLRSTPHTSSQHQSDSEIAAAEARVREQEAHVLRLIVQGAPTQMAEDLLRQLTTAAEEVKRKRFAGT